MYAAQFGLKLISSTQMYKFKKNGNHLYEMPWILKSQINRNIACLKL